MTKRSVPEKVFQKLRHGDKLLECPNCGVLDEVIEIQSSTCAIRTLAKWNDKSECYDDYVKDVDHQVHDVQHEAYECPECGRELNLEIR